jgi:hypothetical protein
MSEETQMKKSYADSDSGSVLVLKVGFQVLVHLDDGGVFVGTVDAFEGDGAVVVVVPLRDPVRDVFPNGYRIGRALWRSSLTVVAEDPW